MRLTLPVPPSANRYWSIWRGRAVTSGAAHEYRRTVQLAARAIGAVPTTQPVAVRIDWFREAKRGDLDNRIKCLLDALRGVAFMDDKQVVELHAYRRDDKTNPRVEVTIEAAHE